jgi:hypothetical protein
MKIALFVTAFFALAVHAQEFKSPDDALGFLDAHFKVSTYTRKGTEWTNPVELQFNIGELNLFQYYGTIDEKHYIEYNEDELAKMVGDETPDGVLFFYWHEIKSVTLQDNDGGYWITITGPVYNYDSDYKDASRTLYVLDKENAQKIKRAIEYCIKALSE